jgi:lipid II:glycine glycyltransferase (peptidoglycan interpeptide bridge formation enzyme)
VKDTFAMIHTFNPLEDRRWSEYVQEHPNASVFHETPWLEALRRTYAYAPVVYSTSAPTEPLTNGIVFCRIESWVTGRRLVSLPFADHCEPLVNTHRDCAILLALLSGALERDVRLRRLTHIELRPRVFEPWGAAGAVRTASYAFHLLDLRLPLEEIYQRTHKSTIQRKITRAHRESLDYEAGNSEALLRTFYALMLRTRRRHCLPPQPFDWFRNLANCMGRQLTIRVALKNAKPIASILTLQSRQTMVYKYGCSDERYHNLGAVPFLFWKIIVEAKALGLQTLDLGRSDSHNTGLITFKGRWGASVSELSYMQLRRTTRGSRAPLSRFENHPFTRVFGWMPDRLLTATGNLLYRHIG